MNKKKINKKPSRFLVWVIAIIMAYFMSIIYNSFLPLIGNGFLMILDYLDEINNKI